MRKERTIGKLLFAIAAAIAGSVLLASPQPQAKALSTAPTTKPLAANPARDISITSKSPEAVEAFKKGRDYSENVRTVEAVEQFKKALEIDPAFALAHAYLGGSLPGGEGLKELERAASLASGLPEAERTLIDIMLAERRGEEDKFRRLQRRLVTMAPGDWRAHFGLGAQLSAERKWDEAIAELKKAVDLEPKAGSVQNAIGYAYLNMGKSDQAVEAFRNYAALMPGEPNPQDSLAEALMASGKFDESEAAFRKAAEISPQFWVAWEGVAMGRFLRDNWAEGREALGSAKEAASRPIDKLETDTMLAWSLAAEGNLAEALRILDGVEKTAELQRVDVTRAFVPIDRALLLADSGKPEEALRMTSAALEKAEKASLPGAVMNNVRRFSLAVRISAESKLGRAADVKKTLGLMEVEASKSPANAELQSMVRFGRGTEAMVQGDFKSAAHHFTQCDDQDYYCRWQLVLAQEKAGDNTGAQATRQRLLAANRREPLYLYVRSKLASKPAQPAKSG